MVSFLNQICNNSKSYHLDVTEVFISNDCIGSLIVVISIRCYQCSSDEDKTSDGCGAYEPFDINKNSPVDCMAEDAVTPGTFCYKSIQQGPRGFIWDGRWRTVIRRCAQISERGISWGCDWGFHENGVYWEECYCAEDGCNGSASLLAQRSQNYQMISLSLILGAIMTYLLRRTS